MAMAKQRTGGMTTIGILNIVFGSIGTLMALLVVLGGGMMAAIGAAGEAEFAGSEVEGVGTAFAGGGFLIMIIGLIGMASCVLMGVSGIGVLKLKPWGRTLSILCGGLFVLLNGYSLMQGGFSLFTLAFLVYGGLLVGLFFTPSWKAAFCPAEMAGETCESEGEHREAA